MYYTVIMLHDGTVLAARPIRKPSQRPSNPSRRKIDPDGVAVEWAESGSDLRDNQNETRFRFMDIIAAKLNTRRAIRELVLPRVAELHDEVRNLREQLDRIENLLPRGAATADHCGA
jgi:hypothetical protein